MCIYFFIQKFLLADHNTMQSKFDIRFHVTKKKVFKFVGPEKILIAAPTLLLLMLCGLTEFKSGIQRVKPV